MDGERWHLRGDSSYEGKDLHKLLGQVDLPVFHDYINKRTPVAPEDRETFWLRAAFLMEDSVHSHFVGYQYKSGDGRRCLVVYEFC